MRRALVIGGGMGGLTAALALLREGVDVEVHEQASVLREVGAGLTLSRSAMKGLASLGLLDAIVSASQVSAGIPFLHYRTGELLWGAAAPSAVDDPHVSRHIFRADLQELLARELATRAPDALQLGHALVGVSNDDDGVVAAFADGSTARGDVLIGADGLHSAVRGTRWSTAAPTFTGQVAWRFLVDADDAKPFMGTGPAAVFLGPDRTVNRYLIRQGRILNCVAIVRTPGWTDEGWSTRGDPAELAAAFADWHPDVRGLMTLARPERLFKWALGVHPPLPTWIDGSMALLGDAAHPMLPFLGMGAAMAIEDGIVLGRAFGLHADSASALRAYEAARRPRTIALADASERQGQLLQSKNPDRFDGFDAPVANRALFDYDPSTAPIGAPTS